MKTYITPVSEITRDWYIVDLEGKSIGRVATIIADTLRGKGKPAYSPHQDMGDGVIVLNADKIRFSGAKMAQKQYYRHSGYAGGLKATPAEKMIQEKPEEMVRLAVAGMIPKNKLRTEVLKRLRIFKGSEHNMEAQQPKPLSI